MLHLLCHFQISSHVKAIDAIYQGTDFMGIRNISFMVKRIRVGLALISKLRYVLDPLAILPLRLTIIFVIPPPCR